mmetsp:Transcript_14909/g.32873  ORF Transcript_14909/g.32873 Transcript_14909/m.32873 type:complete len:157 (-) Transcript_14909:229-699(-)|eukprot:CAMPEP_0206421308 /NCGR_PEP_ID=MMETSP0324_2-20121206/1369_1 /ASSEMBLY_ACC=CAM_ASM_000836 /TAXON_ID=2866 /ORGANISM="Crypthecodinium cohnii, Strain Seligo" /LENGTH=156 /DNA_ID=CAMNT_0053885375 /DNA_START=67 /DNA_END=537 /DNA_ORIENTATION=-
MEDFNFDFASFEAEMKKAKAAEGSATGDQQHGQSDAQAPKRQFSDEQGRQLLSELTPKLKEELAEVLRAQQLNTPLGDRKPMSKDLSRILQRFQRRAGFGPDGKKLEDSDEIWPMYLGLGLFVNIAFIFLFLWAQERFAGDDPYADDDLYWQLREW